jgi:hypothetical protein
MLRYECFYIIYLKRGNNGRILARGWSLFQNGKMKRLMITKKGTAILHECYSKLNEINNTIFEDMPEEDMLLCIQLLSPTESRISNKWIEDKRKSFSDL